MPTYRRINLYLTKEEFDELQKGADADPTRKVSDIIHSAINLYRGVLKGNYSLVDNRTGQKGIHLDEILYRNRVNSKKN